MSLGYCFFNSYVFVSAVPPTPYFYEPFTGAVLGTGGTFDRTWDIAIDSQNFVYVCGQYNASANIYDRTGTVLGTLPAVTGDAAFACKFSNAGVLQYSLIVDSAGSDVGQFLTIENSNVYLTGYYIGTPSIIFRSNLNASTTLGTLPATLGVNVAFACKFSNTGSLVYSLVVDSAGSEIGYGSATDSLNNFYLCGNYTGTPNIIFVSNSNVSTTVGTLPASSGSAAFTTKFSSTGTLLYSFVVDATLNNDTAWTVTCDAFSNVYFGGQYYGTPNIVRVSNANVSTTVGTLPATLGTDVAFATKFSDNGTLQYSLIVDGTGSDVGYKLACDSFSNVYFVGQYAGTPNIIFRSNANVSTTVGTLSASSGTFDGFACKFDSAGTLQYSYIVSGTGNDGFWSASCDASSNVLLSGYYVTNSSFYKRSNTNVSVLVDTFPTSTTDVAFVSKFDSNGNYFFSIIADSTANDGNYATSFDARGNMYFGGQNQNGYLRDASSRQYLNYSIINPTQPPQTSFPLDAVSSTAIANITGTYSLRRVLTSYTGPVANIRRSADSVTANIFSDRIGTLTLSNLTSVSTWLGASTGFVTTWYDQSGKGNHGLQSNVSNQPSLDIANLRLVFDATDFFTINAGTVPLNNTYTVSVRHGAINNTAGGMVGAGVSGVSNQTNNFRRNGTGYRNYWWGNDFSGGTYAANNTVTWVYDGATTSGLTTLFVNGTSAASLSRSGWAGVATATDFIGKTTFEEYLTGELHWVTIFKSALSPSDRIAVENQTLGALPIQTIPARLGAYYVKTDPTGSTGIPQLGYYTNFERIINASTSSQVNGLVCDAGSNLYAAYSYTGTTPVIIDQNSTTLGSLPTSSAQAGALTKFDSVGTVLFSRIIDSTGAEAGTSVALDSQSNVYIGTTVNGAVTVKDQTGTSLGTIPAPTGSSATFSKFSSTTGNYQYSLVIDSTAGTLDQGLTVVCDSTSNVYVGGSYNTGTANINYVNTSGTSTRLGILPSQNSAFLTKFDPIGVLQYSLLVFTTGAIVQSTQGAVCDPTGNVYMSGFNFGAGTTITRVSNSNVSTTLGTIPTPASYAGFTVKFSSTGNLLYSLYIDSAGTEISYSPSLDPGSNLYVGGYYTGTPNIVYVSNSNVSTTLGTLPASSGQAAYMSKFSSTGTLLYSYVLDTTGADATYGTACDLYGNVYFTGEYTGTPTLQYVSNSNVATTITTLPVSSGAAAFMISISPTGIFNYARIVDVTTNNEKGLAVACDPTNGNVFLGGQYNGAASIKDQLGTTIATLPTLTNCGFICEFAGSSTPVAQNLVAPLSNVYYTTIPNLNLTTEARLVDSDVDVSGNVYFLSQRSTTAPVLTSKNAVTIKTMPTTTVVSTTLVKFNNEGRYEWDVYSTYFGNAGANANVMCSVSAENSNVYIGSQQSPGFAMRFYDTSNVNVDTIPSSSEVDCYIAKFDTTGTIKWKSYMQGAQNFFPSVSASPNDNAVYIAGTKNATAQLNIFNNSNSNVGNIPVSSVAGSFLVKYDRDGTYQWRTYMDNSTIVNRGVTTDAKSNVYVSGYFTGTTTANVYASTGSTPAAVITKTGTNNAMYLVKYLTDGSFSWYAFMNTTGVAQQFGQGCDPKSNVYVCGFTTPNMDIFDRTNYSVARTTITGPSGVLVKFSEDGYYQWYARVYSPTGVTFDKVCTDVDFDTGSNVYATFSMLTPSAGATSNVTVQDGLGNLSNVSVGVINTSFNMVVKFLENGLFQWACPQTTVVQNRTNSGVSVFGSNVYVTGTKLTTATTIRDRNLTSVSTIPTTTSNAAYIAQYFTDGTYAFTDFQVTNFSV